MENKNGYTIAYISWDDCKPRVAGRFKTKEEKDEFLKHIYEPGSGWMEEELQSISVIPDYHYMLPA